MQKKLSLMYQYFLSIFVSGLPVVHQLWADAQEIINMANAVMIPFLHLLCVEEGHGLSPFCHDFEKNIT